MTSFKLFMAYPNVLMVDDGVCFYVMREAAKHGAVVCVHAENGYAINVLVQEAVAAGNTAPKYHYLTRPPELEGEATARAITLAEYAGAPLYVVHVTCAQALHAIAEARDRSDLVHGETCTQYLFLTSEELERPGFEGAKYVFTPPLRSKEHLEKIWRGLWRGDLSAVSTDHCPFCYEEQPHGLKFSKRQGEREGFHKIPNGGPGIEHRIPVFFDGAVKKRGMTRSRFVELVATNPAKLFGIYPQEGHDRGGLRCRHRAVRPGRALDDPRRGPALARRLFAVRGLRGAGARQEDLPARPADRRRRAMARPRRHGRVPEARRERPAVKQSSRRPARRGKLPDVTGRRGASGGREQGSALSRDPRAERVRASRGWI